jgi:phosphatidylglycerophosphate synthase
VSGTPGARLTPGEARRRGQGSAHLDADPTYARWIMRRVSAWVSWAICAFTPISADAVTLASITLGVVGGLLAGIASAPAAATAVVLLQLAYLLDVADGEVARIRGTAGLRGTYLDLIGHVLQNRALYAGAGWSLIVVTDTAPWAVAAVLATLGLATPFGHYARMQVLRSRPADGNPDHPGRVTAVRPAGLSAGAWLRWGYRRLAFLWNYPASMNLFSLVLVVDLFRYVAGASGALAVPALLLVFGPTLAAKQVLHAVRLLRAPDWAT